MSRASSGPGPAHDDPLAPGRRALLVVAHPGHELRVYGWLARARPPVCVLTDGSGSQGAARLGSTRALLRELGATPGPIFGRFQDRALYAALLDRAHAPLVAVAAELATVLVRDQVDVVVADAAEGYNPAHDVCRLVVDAAVRRAARRLARPLVRLAFTLFERPDAPPGAGPVERLPLDPLLLARKTAAAHAYGSLAHEIDHALATWGEAAFATECFRRLGDDTQPAAAPRTAPLYEAWGEAQVAAGVYARVLRWDEHVRPLADALAAFADDA
jgi:hypothetical protein